MKIKFYATIGSLFILAGTLIGSQFYMPNFMRIIDEVHAKTATVAAVKTTNEATDSTLTSNPISGIPNHITIPSLHISNDIIAGVYNSSDQSWTLSTSKAMFATITSQPNTVSGNTFIYAHARVGLFVNLINAKEGTEAIISTANGHTFTYRFVSSRDVDPSDTSVLKNSAQPQLTLQTCSGIWSEHRHLVTFNLVGAK